MLTSAKQAAARRNIYLAAAGIGAAAMLSLVITMVLSTSYPTRTDAAPPAPAASPSPSPSPSAAAAPSAHSAAPAATSTAPAVPLVDDPHAGGGARARDSVAQAASMLAQVGAHGRALVDAGPRPAPLGEMAKEDVQAGVQAVIGRVRDCYERGLAIDPKLAGKITLKFTLAANDEGRGAVTVGEVAESDMQAPFFEACVLKEVASAEFKAPGGGGSVDVVYPFTFASNEEDAEAP